MLVLSAERAQRVKTNELAGAAAKVFAERATLPTAGENMASWVEGYWGMTMVLMRLKGRLSGLAAGAPRADVSPIGTSTGTGTCHAHLLITSLLFTLTDIRCTASAM